MLLPDFLHAFYLAPSETLVLNRRDKQRLEAAQMRFLGYY
jgi:hypothetical protein